MTQSTTHPVFKDLQLIFTSIKPKNLLIIDSNDSPYVSFFKTTLPNTTITHMRSISEYVAILTNPSTTPQYSIILITPSINNVYPALLALLLQLSFAKSIQHIFFIQDIGINNTSNETIFSIDFLRFRYNFKEYIDDNSFIKLHAFNQPTYYPSQPLDFINILTKSEKKLNIAYWLSHNKLKGGLKCLLIQIEHLAKRGHHITVYRKGEPGEAVMPNWWTSNIPNLKIKLITQNIPIDMCLEKDTDLLVLCTAHTILKIKDFSLPIILWEEGYPALFGEMPNIGKNYIKLNTALTTMYRSSIYIFSVSTIVQKILKTRYGRNTLVLPNGIDTNFYKPNPSKSYVSDKTIIILLVGKPTDRTKRFDRALRVLDKVYTTHKNIKVQWLSQEAPLNLHRPYIEWIIMPTQTQLQQCYRDADILLSTSIYEGFGMPPLEAMASGTSVVAVNSGGILDYALDKENILLCKQGDEETLYTLLISLITSPNLRKRLAIQGRKTALKYDYTNIAKLTEQYFYSTYVNWHNNH